MKIIESKPLTDQQLEDRDWRDAYELKVESNGKTVSFSFWDGESEDATLHRDFSDVFSISEAIKLAYEAGKRGEPLEEQEISIDLD